MTQQPPSRLAFTAWNCLFAVLALQRRAIAPEILLAALPGWARDKVRPLGQALAELGLLPGGAREDLEAAVRDHFKAHQSDPKKTLSAVALPALTRAALLHIDDAEWRTCLGWIGSDAGADAAVTATLPGTELTGTSPDALVDTTANEALLPDPPPAHSRYLPLHFHARGGLGEVFVAQDQELHREVALKEIQQPYAHDPRARERFLLEAEVTGRLEHPGVVPVYGLGQHADGRLFYAMRFIRGETLKQAAARLHAAADAAERRLLLRQLLTRFVAVCNTVAYAHSRGILHRDLKPANVMLGPYGETLVVDWGLAKPFDRGDAARAGEEITLTPEFLTGSGLTRAGGTVGTPAYSSPEQAGGGLVSKASDVYSLGATLYQILTGQPPFPGDGLDLFEVLGRVRAGKFDPPRRVREGVPPALEAICLKAMALRPADRYGSALELADDVERWLADEPVSVHREPLAARVGRWVRRHPTAVGIALTAVVLAVGGWVAFDRWQAYDREATQRRAEEHVAAALELREKGKFTEAAGEYGKALALCKGEAGLETLERRVANQLAEAEALGREHALRAVRQQAERDAAAGLIEARQGDLDAGVALVTRAAAAIQEDPGVKDRAAELGRQARALQLYQKFRRLTDTLMADRSGVREGSEERPRERPTGAALAARCREALDVYRVLEDPEWPRALGDPKRGPAAALSPEQVQEARSRVVELLTLWAMHALTAAPVGEAGRKEMNHVVRQVSLALGQGEDSVGYWRLREYVHGRLGELAEEAAARERVRQLRAERPAADQSDDLYFSGQMLAYLRGDRKAAVAEFRRAAEADPRNFNAHFSLFLHSAPSDLKGRLSHLTACLALQPRSPLLYYFRGMTYFQLDQLELAYLDFDAAARHGTTFALGHFYRGRMLIVQKRWAEAEADLDRAIKLDAGLFQAYPWHAITLAKVGRHSDAARVARLAVKNEPNDGLTHFYAARAFAQAVDAARKDTKELRRGELAAEYTRESVRLLQRAVDLGFKDFRRRLDPNGDFDPVRADPEFLDLYSKIRPGV